MSDSDESWYARPVFFVTNAEAALRFYNKLGFQEAWRHEEQGTLIVAQVNRDGAELILNRDATRAGGGRLFLSLNPGQVARCVAAFEAAGVGVSDTHWGMPMKSVRDPDGNELLFYDDDLSNAPPQV
jgi:catechol 2,3-dioxygenase-like lactoylglutathione lyase family enzyme